MQNFISLKQKVIDTFKNLPGVMGVGSSATKIYIYVLDDDVKKRIKMELNLDELEQIDVITTGEIVAAED